MAYVNLKLTSCGASPVEVGLTALACVAWPLAGMTWLDHIEQRKQITTVAWPPLPLSSLSHPPRPPPPPDNMPHSILRIWRHPFPT